MNYGLDTFGHDLQFFVLVGASNVEHENGFVRGNWKAQSQLTIWTDVGRARSMVEDFLNSPTDADGIVTFTKRYGPLQAYCREPPEDTSFKFTLEEWREDQQRLANMWCSPLQSAHTAAANIGIKVDVPERFILKGGKLLYQCSTLLRFMRLQITAWPRDRRGICHRGGCNKKFFTTDLKLKYCSQSCSEAARCESKLKHWNRKKKTYLAERKAKRSKQSKKED